MADIPPNGNNLERFRKKQAAIDYHQARLDYERDRAGYYAHGREVLDYVIDEAHPAMCTGVRLYPWIYRGWAALEDNLPPQEVSFMAFADLDCAQKYCSANVVNKNYLKPLYPRPLKNSALGVLVCVPMVLGFFDFNNRPIPVPYPNVNPPPNPNPVPGNPSLWEMDMIKTLVQLFLNMVEAEVSSDLWDNDGCYLRCQDGLKVIANVFRRDDPAAWNASLEFNINQLALGIGRLILNDPYAGYWPQRGSFLMFFGNSVEIDLPTRLRRILRHTYLMKSSWDILARALGIFQHFRNTPPLGPNDRYWKLYDGMTSGKFAISLNTGHYNMLMLPALQVWGFYSALCPAFLAVFSRNYYSQRRGIDISNYVRNTISHFHESAVTVSNPQLSAEGVHAEFERVLPGLFSRTHEFLDLRDLD